MKKVEQMRLRRNEVNDFAMPITVHVPPMLRADCGWRGHCEGKQKLVLSASSVRAVLEEIERHYPRLYRRICDETGAVRRHVNLFVNTVHIRDLDSLDTALQAGDALYIMPAVSGG